MKKLWLVLGLLILALPVHAGEEVAKKFEVFCGEWMQKLVDRERDNRAAVKWQTGADGVVGEFTGYSTEHKCILKDAATSADTPIGKITYRELLYRQKGASKTEAESSTPQAVEATEVTEIFRYTKGKWVY